MTELFASLFFRTLIRCCASVLRFQTVEDRCHWLHPSCLCVGNSARDRSVKFPNPPLTFVRLLLEVGFPSHVNLLLVFLSGISTANYLRNRHRIIFTALWPQGARGRVRASRPFWKPNSGRTSATATRRRLWCAPV
jgi:hypothetical protein